MTDQTPTCEQVRLLNGTPTRIRHGHGIDEPCPFGPRPDSGIDALLDDLLNVREGLVSASEAIERAIALARLSTPRTETSEPHYSEEYGGFTFKPDPPALREETSE